MGKDPAGADGVVADFAVAHVVVRWKPDCGAVGDEGTCERSGYETVDRWGVGFGHRVGWAVWCMTDAVSNHNYDGSSRFCQGVMRSQREHHGPIVITQRWHQTSLDPGNRGLENKGSEENSGLGVLDYSWHVPRIL